VKPILIAECCQNHGGRREVLAEMIHRGADAGADYVKIQAIRSSELAHRERFDTGAEDSEGRVTTIRRPFAPELERLTELDLSIDDEAWFVETCRQAGVRSMITLFTRTAAREVADLGYDAAKIASYDCGSIPLLRDVGARWRTVVVSTGSSFDHEIEAASKTLADNDLSLLHCVTIYPTPMSELHLARMEWLRRHAKQVGFSDHTLVERDGVWASKIALALGASHIERHFTVLDASATKDGPVSIGPDDLAELRRFADLDPDERRARIEHEYPTWREGLGEAERELSDTELLNRDYYRGRFASRVGDRSIDNWIDEALPE